MIDSSETLISGTELGFSANRCYLPVFQSASSNPHSNNWYLGNIFMKNYNIIFDMSPLEENKGYLQVGFARNAAQK